MHQKRNEMAKTWPIARKGSKYLTVASHEKSKGIPLVFILRDILKIAKTRKEARYIVLNKLVKVNNKVRTSEIFPLLVFDVLSLDKNNKNYRLIIANKKFKLEEISAKEAEVKIVKITGKRIVRKNKIQINLQDGHNYITKENFSVGDSVVLNTKENKIVKILQLKKNADVEIVAGKHAGQKGKLEDIKQLERSKMYKIKLKDKEIELPLKTLLIIE